MFLLDLGTLSNSIKKESFGYLILMKKKWKQKLNFLMNINDKDWENYLMNLGIKKIINFDFKNKTLINNLNQIGLPIKKEILEEQL